MIGLTQTVIYPTNASAGHVDALGMREMQAKVYAARDSQYILIKSPPASGKSRALMYLALDKIYRQGLSKVIIAVPEKSIGKSFESTKLTATGFAYDWQLSPRNDLCGDATSEKSKVQAFLKALASDNPADDVILCTHATLRFAMDAMGRDPDADPVDGYMRLPGGVFDVRSPWAERLASSLFAIDEFHHTSDNEENRLGEVVRTLIADGRPHIVAMTGSYFRGDRLAVMRPEDEERFTRVVYTYYQQLSGYEYLKTLGIDYRFYHGPWTNTIGSVLDTTKKTIVHIPSVNAAASTGDKLVEVGKVIDAIGTVDRDLTVPGSGIVKVRAPDGRIVTIADLVTPETQGAAQAALRLMRERDDMDVVIALGMAKEGFDWIWCEHAITVGVRSSMTEVVQIIGRTTRDAPGKRHAQFTNLIAEPIETPGTVQGSINSYLKAIAASLLMEQVMAPVFSFRTAAGDDTDAGAPTVAGIDITKIESAATAPWQTITLRNIGRPQSEAGKRALDNIEETEAAVVMDDRTAIMALNPDAFPHGHFQKTVLREIIAEKNPDVPVEELPIIADWMIARQEARRRSSPMLPFGDAMPNDVLIKRLPDDRKPGEQAGASIMDLTRHLTVDDIDLNLVRDMNPWRDSYAIRSKELGESALRQIHDAIRATRIDMSPQEAADQYPRVLVFIEVHGQEPRLDAEGIVEQRLAQALAKVRQARRDYRQGESNRAADQAAADAVATGTSAN